MRLSRVLVLSLLRGVAACSQPRIDTSNDEQMKNSIVAVREALPSDQRARFDTALQVLAFSQVDVGDVFTQPAAVTAGKLEATMKELIQGKTGPEIIATADSVLRARDARELQELEAQKDSVDRSRAELQKFVVSQARFYKRPSGFGLPDPVVEMSVRNGTGHAISRAYFVGTLTSPGRSVPWVKDKFEYQVRGGLEPGEHGSWRIWLNSLSDWSAKTPNDAVLNVEVVRLDGPDGSTLYSTAGFGEKEAQRLMVLRAKIATH